LHSACTKDPAKAPSVTRSVLSRLINRKAGVSAKIALRLERAICSTAGFWLHLQLKLRNDFPPRHALKTGRTS